MKGSLSMDVRAEFMGRFGVPPTILARAPGRVNLLGEHVDYNDGPVLPVAINRAVYLAARPRDDDLVVLAAHDLGEQIEFRVADLEEKKDIHGNPLPKWALYPAGVAWACSQHGYNVHGMMALYSSDIPIGAGLSSSAAVEVAFAVAWQALGGWQVERMTLARLCQRAENDFVGLNCGLMDQFASIHGVAGHVLYFDTRSLEWEALPMPVNTVLVVADSGVRRSLASSAYNERRAACERAVEILRGYLPHLRSLRDISTVEFAAFSEALPLEVRKRAEHVVKEIHRVFAAVTALRQGDARSFGAYMYAGHASLRDLYEVSCQELDILVEIARGLPGCYGARLTGAGFGGCTINLVQETHAEEFAQGLLKGYLQQTGRQANVYLCRASEGAKVEKI
jgi:galactokinase